jgi:hypothetical protein
MMTAERLGLPVLLLVLPALFSVTAVRAEEALPVRLETPTFSVRMTDAGGTEKDFFGRGNPAYFDITFALALSASSRYATTITLLLDSGGGIVERVLFQGTLEEGFYQLFVPAGKLPSNRKEGTAKIVIKNRFFPKKFTGKSIYIYRRWEGTYKTVP